MLTAILRSSLFLALLIAAAPPAEAAGAGSLDTAFGGGGVATTSLIGGVEAVVLQGDGKIISVGTCNHHFCLTRHNIDGTPDLTFGVLGQVTTNISAGFDEAHAVALQTDGKIVVAGGCDLNPYFASDFCLVRYNTNGSLDTTFGPGGTGIVTTDFALGIDPFENLDTVHGVVVQPDGKIVAAGECADYNVGIWRFCVARYNTNGSLDFSYGSAGKVLTSILSNDDEARAIALQADGKVVVAGGCIVFPSSFCLARYNSDGTLDVIGNLNRDLLTAIFKG